MRRVIRKRIRHTEPGVDLAADINADIAINVGRKTVPATPAEPREEDPPERDPRRPDASEPGGTT
jgi:hypothetical protein